MEVGRKGRREGRNNGETSEKKNPDAKSKGEGETKSIRTQSENEYTKETKNVGRNRKVVIFKDECPGCGWNGEVDWECRFCPECEWELEGWSERRGKDRPRESGLKFKQILDGCGVEDCRFC